MPADPVAALERDRPCVLTGDTCQCLPGSVGEAHCYEERERRSAANEFGSGLGPSAGGEPEVSGLPATGTSAANKLGPSVPVGTHEEPRAGLSPDGPRISAAPVYRWHTQTLRGGGDVPPEERGDCVRACITSILGLPLDAIENVHGENWWDRLRVQVNLHGYDLAITDTRWEPPMEAYWIATVPSLNLGPEPDGSAAEHCVVARGYTLIHDPSLGERYDDAKWVEAWDADKITAGWVLVPLDPAEVRRAA